MFIVKKYKHSLPFLQRLRHENEMVFQLVLDGLLLLFLCFFFHLMQPCIHFVYHICNPDTVITIVLILQMKIPGFRNVNWFVQNPTVTKYTCWRF